MRREAKSSKHRSGPRRLCNEEKFSIFAAVFLSYSSFSFEFHQDDKPIVNKLINNSDSLSDATTLVTDCESKSFASLSFFDMCAECVFLTTEQVVVYCNILLPQTRRSSFTRPSLSPCTKSLFLDILALQSIGLTYCHFFHSVDNHLKSSHEMTSHTRTHQLVAARGLRHTSCPIPLHPTQTPPFNEQDRYPIQ